MDHGVIERLANRLGDYEGEGTNHEGQKFFGSMTIESLLDKKGILLSFKAVGEDGPGWFKK